MAGMRGNTMRRRRRRRGQDWRIKHILLPAGVLLIAVLAGFFLARTLRGRPAGSDAAATLARQATAAPVAAQTTPATQAALTQPLTIVSVTPEPTAAPLVAAAPQSTAAPVSSAAAAAGARSPAERAQTRPTPTAPGFMPVFSRANTDEKIVAITVDDCFQAENLQAMVDAAIAAGGKFTIFPIGQNVLREKHAEVLKYAWENGFELENHTFTHNGLYGCTDAELAEEVYKQQMALSYILGVEYQCHFLRPKGGDASHDQRLQKYAEQLGYYGVARWCASSGSGTVSDKKLAGQLEPGAIFLFHTTDKDRDKLVRFIPWIVSQGYQLVTLNEMFGYPANETRPLSKPAKEYEIPPLQPYERVYVTYKRPAYAYGVYLLQAKLVELGYLEDAPDGIFGPNCEAAVKRYQKDHGLEETGVADVELQKRLLEG